MRPQRGAALALLAPAAAFAQESSEELAKKLANPIASLISVPAQLNYDDNIGPARDGNRTTLNIPTHDWKAKEWSVPLNGTVAKLVRFGKQPVSFGAGVRYRADSPEGGPHGWGGRVFLTLLFPA